VARREEMKISVVVNTCCLGPRAHEITGSCSPTPHALRAFSLGNFILPFYEADSNIDEIIVVGEFVEGPGYTYVPSPSRHFSCVDALAQRQAGFEASTGDLIIFTHDDHMIDYTFAATLRAMQPFPEGVEVVLPQRRRRTFEGHTILNNGRDEGYISGHAVVMARAACEKAPWRDVDEIHQWDRSHTNLIARAGLGARWSDDLWVWDVEIGATRGDL
jgi:hypothetical protein